MGIDNQRLMMLRRLLLFDDTLNFLLLKWIISLSACDELLLQLLSREAVALLVKDHISIAHCDWLGTTWITAFLLLQLASTCFIIVEEVFWEEFGCSDWWRLPPFDILSRCNSVTHVHTWNLVRDLRWRCITFDINRIVSRGEGGRGDLLWAGGSRG